MRNKDSFTLLRLKIMGGYVSLIAVFIIASVVVVCKSGSLEENSVKYRENIDRRTLSEGAFLQLFDLTQLGGQAAIWDSTRIVAYEKKEKSIMLTLDSMIRTIPDTAQVRRVREIKQLVIEKKGYLLAIHEDMEHLRDVSGLMQQKMPDIIRQANRANQRLTDEVSENLKENRQRTTGMFGWMKSKKKANAETEAENQQALNRAKLQTDRILTSLATDIQQSQERSANQLFQHMEDLVRKESLLNEKITQLASEFNAEDSQMRRFGSTHLMTHQRETLHLVMWFGVAAFVLAIISYWLFHRDAKKRHRNQVLLEQSNRHNEELLTLRRNMMLTVSHDLRSPLTSIMGYADLIAETTKDEKCKQYEDAIMQSSERMLTLLNTLLSYYRLDTGKEEVEMVPFRVKDVLSSLLMEYEPIAEIKNVAIEGTFVGEDTVVMGDRKRILQIGSNILSNAVKFTQKGTVKVGVEYEANTLTIKVHDTGTGMTEEQVQRIFAPFNRLDNADTQEGFGLGLSIAKALAELLGGSIDVESHVGFGSLFTVTIPVVEGDEEILQLAEKNTTALPEGLRIAVVDDDVTVLRMTVEMLAKKNVQVVGCGTVNDLLERMRQCDYDLIITDIKLGGISGFDLLELLRDANIGNSKTVPVLAMTGRTERKAEDFIDAGFSGCLLKPFSYAELTQAIANSVKEDATFKIPKADFTTLLQGEDDVKGMLTLLVEQTETEMSELKSALETGNMEAISFLQHKLESRWELLGIVKPMLKLRDALKGEGSLDKAVEEVSLTAEQLVRQVREKIEGGEA
ncbi:MAG: His Kinase A (phosphoacceptor) domain [bacterium F082]|nr:MAG: His Kinase A (phosphoacceptor) domain [bacterium F082]KWW27486.1 MAG: His Kinase A (phosphoacceptor) domain [bacterium P201]